MFLNNLILELNLLSHKTFLGQSLLINKTMSIIDLVQEVLLSNHTLIKIKDPSSAQSVDYSCLLMTKLNIQNQTSKEIQKVIISWIYIK